MRHVSIIYSQTSLDGCPLAEPQMPICPHGARLFPNVRTPSTTFPLTLLRCGLRLTHAYWPQTNCDAHLQLSVVGSVRINGQPYARPIREKKLWKSASFLSTLRPLQRISISFDAIGITLLTVVGLLQPFLETLHLFNCFFVQSWLELASLPHFIPT